MLKHLWICAPLLLFTRASGVAQDSGERLRLVGAWVSEDVAANSSVWTIESKSDGYQISEIRGGNTISAYVCKPDGHDCEIKTSGKKATLSMWFNGPKLVQMETQGSSVVKRRFSVLPREDVMEVEVIPIVPDGKAETLRFKRVELSAHSK